MSRAFTASLAFWVSDDGRCLKMFLEGRSPFTFSHARHIKIIAWMFVVSFALNLFISPDFIEMIHVGMPTSVLFPIKLGDIQRSISTSNPSLGLSFASRSLPFGSTGLCCRPIRMITCRGLNMAKHLIVELEAVLLEKGKSSKDLVRATGHTTVNVSRIRQAKMRGIRMDTLMEICLELDCQPGDILKIVTDEEFDRLVERAS